MTPEADKIYNAARNSLIDGLGLSDPKLEELKSKISETVEQNRLDESQLLIQDLKKKLELRKKIEEAPDLLTPVLTEYGVEKVNIEPTRDKELSPESDQISISIDSKTYPKTRKPDKYIEGASPAIINMCVRKSGNRFSITDPTIIEKRILTKKANANEKFKEDAKLRVYTTIINTSIALLDEANKTKVDKVSTLMDQILISTKDPVWKETYLHIRNIYGDMSPNEFIGDVLLRFYPMRKEKLFNSTPKEIEKKNDRSLKLTPSSVTPTDNLILCNRLVFENILINLTEEFNINFNDLKQIFGTEIQNIDDVKNYLNDNRSQMVEMRQKSKLLDEERLESTDKIIEIINHLTKSKIGWNKISNEYKGFKILFLAMKGVKNEEKLKKLIDIIFPLNTFHIDTKNSFIITDANLINK